MNIQSRRNAFRRPRTIHGPQSKKLVLLLALLSASALMLPGTDAQQYYDPAALQEQVSYHPCSFGPVRRTDGICGTALTDMFTNFCERYCHALSQESASRSTRVRKSYSYWRRREGLYCTCCVRNCDLRVMATYCPCI
ncbi:hypothetical protein BOX15_Mlig022488g2 [Macrostomum lignano]|uniref:Uncharacterized protein n=2 Tax=Macrostomum lignano TaxID=282301 RepID=A0A267EXA2_9PLAT|nr:hypothetical protein BOX15_Mlig022488g3 [Macrostomum lignano]PAA66148.1 hypothetical protein BOX15_Mlig022488g2 [Macrostomum lignano]